MNRTLNSLRKRLIGLRKAAPGFARTVRLIWYDPDSDPKNPSVSYDSEAADRFFTDEGQE